MKLAWRLLLYAFAMITVLIAAILIVVGNRMRDSITAENTSSLEREARFVGEEWLRGADPDSLADAAGRALQRRVTIIDSTGVVLGDSEFDGARLKTLENHGFRPEIIAASRHNAGVARRVSPSRGDEELYVAVRSGSGFARVSVNTGVIDSIFRRARAETILAGFIALAAATMIAAVFARRVSRPIVELRDAARAAAAGNPAARGVKRASGEVGDLATSLDQLSSRLGSLESVRRDFVTNVSHELRTPLTVVSGFAETLAQDDPGPETRREFAEMILANTKRMQRIVDDLLDLSRIESGGWIPRPEMVDISDAARDVLISLQPKAEATGTSIRTYIPAAARTVRADRSAVRQILSSLLENAIRHAPGGVVTLFGEAAPGGTWIGVRDTGEGIAEEHLPRIFERFYRVDSGRSRDEGGTGLGLAIVKHLAEAHGGRVRASSRRGEGTSIAAFFPNAEADAAL